MKPLVYRTAAIFGVLALVLAGAPTASASITVQNENEATIINFVGVSASSGGNYSRAGRGGDGGEGGNVAESGDGDTSNTAGDGGEGGSGGAGGDITTGDAIGTAIIENDVNSTETDIEVNQSDENQYNETFDLTSTKGMSRDSAYAWDYHFEDSSSRESSESHEASESESSSDSSSMSDDEDGEEQSSESSSESESSESHESSASEDLDIVEDESSTSETSKEWHDNLETHYTRTYAGCGCDEIEVRNRNSAKVVSAVAVMADSGSNDSIGKSGGDGEDGGNVTTSGGDEDNMSSNTAGDGGAGGEGGTGGTIMTGGSDSYAEIMVTSGRSITRIVRNLNQ